jgi:arylsulfatase A-like enzyme
MCPSQRVFDRHVNLTHGTNMMNQFTLRRAADRNLPPVRRTSCPSLRSRRTRSPSYGKKPSAACLIIAALLLAPLTALHAADAPKRKPNVLFIISDDLKPLLGCYGTSWIQSPNIDRLAAKGTVFKANYCQVTFCAPTRFSLLTGLRPDSTGVYLNPDQPQDLLRSRLPDVVTLPQHFKNHGYITHPLHKVFDGRTVDQGHDAASWTVPYGPWELAPGEKRAPGGYQDPATKARLYEALKQGKPSAGPATESCDIPDNAYHDGGVAHTAAKRIREFAKEEQPFFLAVGFVKPHLPFIAPKKYWDLYDRGTLPLATFPKLPDGSPYDLAFYSNSGELRAYSDVPKDGPIPEALQRELIHGYAACVSYIDAQVGLLMQTLADCGVADDTIICLWGDHGWDLGEHGHWGKLTNYEDAARAPLILSGPGFAEGKRVSALTEFLDVYPTLCELAGLPIPAHVEGKSLVPLLRGENVTLHEAALTQMSHRRGKNGTMGWSLRTSRYRYIEWRSADFSADKPVFGSHTPATELYDYESDPLDRENLARKTEHAAVLKEQQALFDKLLPHLPKRLE